MDSQSSTHSKSALGSPLTSSLDEQDTPSASSSYFIEGPWEQRNRRFQNVLLHVCSFILILEFAERVSYYGINQGLKNFMGKLGWSQVGSNSLKSTWTSICYLSPLLGGYIADEKWGRFKTLWVFGVWYTLGAFLVTVSAYPKFMEPEHGNHLVANLLCHIGLFAGVAVGTGAIKANVITFGADQFDPNDPNEVTQKEHFFSYFYIVINLGAIFSYGYLSVLCVEGTGAITKDYGYFACFLICGGVMVFAYALFLFGSPRYVHFAPQDSALTKLCTIVKGNCAFSYEARMLYYGLIAFGSAFPLNLLASFLSDWLSVGQYLSYLVVLCCAFGMYAWIRYGMNTAYMDKSKASNGGKFNDETVDEIKMVIRVLPFASFMIMWECAYDQLDANFQSIAQQCDLRVGADNISDFDAIQIPGASLGAALRVLHDHCAYDQLDANFQSIAQQCDLRVGADNISDFDAIQIPGASLGIFDPLTIILLIPVLDGFVYPLWGRVFGRPPSAFGKVLTGLIVAMLTMVWSGFFEIIRRNSGVILYEDANGTLQTIPNNGSNEPMNHTYWAYAIPMYVFTAVAECLINVTAYELFYTEVPVYLKSTCQAINLFMVAMGSNLTSTFTLLFEHYITNDLNDGHFEYMYWTLGALSLINIVAYVTVMQWMEFGMVRFDADDELLDGTVFDSHGMDITSIQRHSSFESISLSRG
ncbi:LOW QUALITY PROTEIN: Proton-dependent Oligopeptide Transporter [Phytophthora megakarya]|uniref:Proton-dependent Oligopeptide Transporter n=1 Tax=Phytophthora megakarya TaxID=4795 RepID=A0A225X5Q6_9STRA|nr:LOW QUALITY PROTEIN: Proton-dependent Oligopeptide Transporter [Phytophthora megakarya]